MINSHNKPWIKMKLCFEQEWNFLPVKKDEQILSNMYNSICTNLSQEKSITRRKQIQSLSQSIDEFNPNKEQNKIANSQGQKNEIKRSDQINNAINNIYRMKKQEDDNKQFECFVQRLLETKKINNIRRQSLYQNKDIINPEIKSKFFDDIDINNYFQNNKKIPHKVTMKNQDKQLQPSKLKLLSLNGPIQILNKSYIKQRNNLLHITSFQKSEIRKSYHDIQHSHQNIFARDSRIIDKTQEINIPSSINDRKTQNNKQRNLFYQNQEMVKPKNSIYAIQSRKMIQELAL